MRIGQLNEIQISLKDVDLLEMQGGFNSYKLPIGKLYNYFKGKLNLSPVAYSGNYQDLENIPPTRVASRGNLGIVRIGDNLEITPDGVLSGTPFRGWLPPDWEEEDEELASFIKNKPDLSVLATYEYVDERDEAVLEESKEHADGGDEVTLDILRNYSDTNAASTLASAKEYADTQDATTLNSARSYTDAEVAGGVVEAKDYTDEREVAIRQTISDTLDESKDYTDTEAASALSQANSYTDAEILASEGREDVKIDAVNTRIDGLEDTLGEGYVFSVDGRQGVVDLSGSYEQKRKNNLEATTDPTPNDDISEGYEILSKWINQTTGEMWVCIQDTEGAANWQHHTLTIDELGSAATADVGTASNQLPTNAIVDGKLSAGLDTKVDKVVGKQLSDENFTLGEKNKLAEAVVDSDPRLTDSREWTAPTVTQAEAEAGTSTERRAFTPERVRQATEAWWQSSPSKEKLDGIEDEATKNATDAQLRDRATHTGEQPISSVTGLQAALDGKADVGDIPDISNLATKQEVEDLDSSLSSVAKSGNYGDLVNTPTLGSASEQDVSFFATAGQGALADTAVQPDDLIPYALTEDVPQNTDEIPEGAINKFITQAEKDKLAGIGPNHYKGIFATLADLIAGVPSPVAGDYAEVSGDENEPTQRYFWDSVILEWVPQGGAVTPEEVKTLYESNPNTNAFTDNEKSKLSGIQMGATANATNAQLRDRSTHTGTQAISTVSGLQDALDGKLSIVGASPTLNSTGPITLSLYSEEETSNFIRGYVGGEQSWYVGKGTPTSEVISLHSYTLNTTLSLRADRVLSSRDFYVNNSLVFHQGNLDLSTVVRTSGAQSIGGSKVFTSSPEVPTPTFNGAAVNKQYVDNLVPTLVSNTTDTTAGRVPITGWMGLGLSRTTPARLITSFLKDSEEPVGFFARAHGAGTSSPTPGAPEGSGNSQMCVISLPAFGDANWRHWIASENGSVPQQRNFWWGQTHKDRDDVMWSRMWGSHNPVISVNHPSEGGAVYFSGNVGEDVKFYLGKTGSNDNINIVNATHNSSVSLQKDRISVSHPIYESGSRVPSNNYIGTATIAGDSWIKVAEIRGAAGQRGTIILSGNRGYTAGEDSCSSTTIVSLTMGNGQGDDNLLVNSVRTPAARIPILSMRTKMMESRYSWELWVQVSQYTHLIGTSLDNFEEIKFNRAAIGVPEAPTGQVFDKTENMGLIWASTNFDPTLKADVTYVDTALNTKVDKVSGKVLSDQNFTQEEKDKLLGISGGATANQTDDFLLDRVNHTGTQAHTTITGLGNSATRNVGTGAGTVAAGDDSRITEAMQKSQNLNDLTNAATARSNLGLGTAATRNTQANLTDYEAGKVALVGYAGWGKGCPTLTDFDDVLMPSGNYRYSASSLNRPEQITEQYGSVLILGNGDEGSTSNHVTRLIVGLNSDRIWMQRSVNLAPWTTPVELYHSGNMPDMNWSNIADKPSTFPPSSHNHAWGDITGAPAQATRWPTWSEVTSKPTTFAPSSHTHGWGDVTGKPAQATRWPSWGEVTGKPGTFTPPTGANGVGTYAFVLSTGTANGYYGATIAGSNIRFSTIGKTTSGITTTPAGTWRIMGNRITNAEPNVAVRIS